MNLERFCCFRRRTGLIIAACLEVVFCVAFLIYYPYVEFPKEFERKYDFSEVIAVLTFNAVIVGFLIIGLVSVSAFNIFWYRRKYLWYFVFAKRNRNCIVPWMFVRTILLCLSCIVMIPLMLLACIVFGPFCELIVC